MTLNCQLPVDPEGGGAVGEYGGGGEVYSEAIAQFPAKVHNYLHRKQCNIATCVY